MFVYMRRDDHDYQKKKAKKEKNKKGSDDRM